ncbi:NUDIX hydrolase [Streptomyces sp. NPDC018833]|uniref:NUDIX hydrolase n=1 Tax=Streptomyces sp. NPDC018833 TaxID=3365053 RepID=UPI0037A7068E
MTEEAFRRIKIRVGAVIFQGEEVALICRTNALGTKHYTLPGGNVEATEDLPAALHRELLEELDLDLCAIPSPPRFTWILDSMVSRPGGTPPRKVHLVYRIQISSSMRTRLRVYEDDEHLGAGQVVWVPYRQTASLHLFPPVPLAQLQAPESAVDAASCLLPPLSDENYTWA